MTNTVEIIKACNGIAVTRFDEMLPDGKMNYVMIDAEHAIGAISDMIGIDLKIESAEWRKPE